MGLKKVLKKIDEMVVNGETPHNVRLDCIDIVQGEIAKKKAHKADSKPDLSQYEIVDCRWDVW